MSVLTERMTIDRSIGWGQIDLVVIPSDTDPYVAELALELSADNNQLRADDIRPEGDSRHVDLRRRRMSSPDPHLAPSRLSATPEASKYALARVHVVGFYHRNPPP